VNLGRIGQTINWPENFKSRFEEFRPYSRQTNECSSKRKVRGTHGVIFRVNGVSHVHRRQGFFRAARIRVRRERVGWGRRRKWG